MRVMRLIIPVGFFYVDYAKQIAIGNWCLVLHDLELLWALHRSSGQFIFFFGHVTILVGVYTRKDRIHISAAHARSAIG
jgi:hypothetical protein